MARTVLAGRIAVSPRTAVLALGDGLAVATFVAAGELRHGGTIAAGAETFAQFGIAWLVVAVALGAYAPDTLARPRRAVWLATTTWAFAVPLGGVIRVVTETGTSLDPTFLAVTLVVGGSLLGGWRAIAAYYG